MGVSQCGKPLFTPIQITNMRSSPVNKPMSPDVSPNPMFGLPRQCFYEQQKRIRRRQISPHSSSASVTTSQPRNSLFYFLPFISFQPISPPASSKNLSSQIDQLWQISHLKNLIPRNRAEGSGSMRHYVIFVSAFFPISRAILNDNINTKNDKVANCFFNRSGRSTENVPSTT